MPDPADNPPVSAPAGPWVRLRSASMQTFIYQRMIGQVAPGVEPGDCVSVYDKHGALLGHGLYNPKSRISLRMLNFDATPIDGDYWQAAVERAVHLRTRTLRLNICTDACRLIHAEGDDLSGLIVDRYGDVLSVEVFSMGIWQRLDALLPLLHELVGTTHHRAQIDDHVLKLEGFKATPIYSDALPKSVTITENGVRFRVDFATGHKTGFFCDQRDNRLKFANLAHDANVLDVCCYTGGFGVYAMTRGEAREVTCVDLDELAIETAKKNANLNQVRVTTVHADAFSYMRQMQTNQRSYDLVALDPPKLIFGKNDTGDGRQRYFDLNRLAASLVQPGGVLLTCSCSGAVDLEAFTRIVTGAVRQAGRSCRIIDSTGAAADHPVSPRCPESAYLKALWLCVT